VADTVIRRARRGEARAWLEHLLARLDAGEDVGDACILFPFSTNGGSGGRYPQIKWRGQVQRVTRIIFEHVAGGPLAPGDVVRHWCDTPRCCNPWHFESGDHDANMADMTRRRRQASGERNGRARLTAEQVRDIRQLAHEHDLGGEVSFVARSYGVTPGNLALVLARKTWVSVEP
jgi:hypothetical protein